MKHISEIINELLTEWAYLVHDGMPNPKNPMHIVQLKETMENNYFKIKNVELKFDVPLLKKDMQLKTSKILSKSFH